MSDKLLPCPFCVGAPRIQHLFMADEPDEWRDAVDVDRNACDVPRDLAKRIRMLAQKEDNQ